MELRRPLYAAVKTFGCQMNERDSEKLSGILQAMGYSITDSEEEADFILYNTCTVREHADIRVFGRLGVLKGLKKEKKGLLIGLCGCMMQEKGIFERIREEHPEVDIAFGTHNLSDFPELMYRLLSGEKRVMELRAEPERALEGVPVRRKYPFKSGVNIMYGCDNFCSYCIVPYVRGRERSREAIDIIREIEGLSHDGVKEVMLLGQNVNSYGLKGIKNPVTFPELLKEVEKVEGIERIRFMSSNPKDVGDELIAVMAESKKICPHIHLALQSGSGRILRAMNRHYTKEGFISLVDKMRAAMPDISITTDIIVGFPGETEEDLEETLEVIERARFDAAFTFIYSKRSGTKAADMEGQIEPKVAREYFDRVLKKVQETAAAQAERFTGRTVEVLVEHRNEKDLSLVTGRMGQNTAVHFKGEDGLIGRIVPVKLKECRGFYYMGELA